MAENKTINKPSLWIWKIFYIVIALAAFAGLNFLVISKGGSSGIDELSIAGFLIFPDVLLTGFLISLFLLINQKVNSDIDGSRAPLVCTIVFGCVFIFVALVSAVLLSLLIQSRAALG